MFKFLNKFKHLRGSIIFSRSKSSNFFKNTYIERHSEPIDYFKWVVLAIPVGAFGLGCWQVQRREWKLNLIKSVTDKSNSEPIELPEDLSELDLLEYTPIKVTGRFLHDKEILMGPRSYLDTGGAGNVSGGGLVSDPKKNQGWLVITPFQLKDRQEIILINRGWVPSQIKNASNRTQGQIEGDLELVGVVRKHENRPQFVPKNNPSKGYWLYRDLNEMAQVAGCEPIFLDVRGPDDMPKGWPLPNQTRINYRNEHLSYLITWFSLSGITGFMWLKQHMRKKIF